MLTVFLPDLLHHVIYVISVLMNEFCARRHENVRLGTFSDWPTSARVAADDLSRMGFFYTGETDRVQCAFCRGYLRNWVVGDTAEGEHRKHFPDCPFMRNLPAGISYEVRI